MNEHSPDQPVAAPRRIFRHLLWIIPVVIILLLLMVIKSMYANLLLLQTATDTSQEIHEARQEVRKPVIPIGVTCRASSVGQGVVLIVTNESDQYLHGVVITMSAPSGEQTSRTIPTMVPHESLELGWMELSPWIVESGETATFSHSDFEDASWLIP